MPRFEEGMHDEGMLRYLPLVTAQRCPDTDASDVFARGFERHNNPRRTPRYVIPSSATRDQRQGQEVAQRSNTGREGDHRRRRCKPPVLACPSLCH